MPTFAHLELTREGPLALLRIERAEKRNALHAPLWASLRDAGRHLAAEPARVLVLHGAGEHFCAGMDLSPTNALFARLAPIVAERDTNAARELVFELKATMQAFAALPFPVIAAIEGACTGAGLELALACDLRVASRTSFFSLPETHLGMVPDLGGTVRLERVVGRARATDLVLTGRRIFAEEGERWGLVDRLVETGTALDAARALAEAMLASAPVATREVLAVLRSAGDLSEEAALARETEAGARAVASGELLEGVEAFLQKRAPRWS